MQKVRCLGHMNEFRHLEADLGGLERQFDLGFRFEEKESETFSIDPKTGGKVWAEPYLALHISIVSFDAPTDQTRALHYGLTRSKWESAVAYAEPDRERLLELTKPQLEADLEELKRGGAPTALTGTVLL